MPYTLSYEELQAQRTSKKLSRYLNALPELAVDFIVSYKKEKSLSTKLAYASDLSTFFYYLTTEETIGENDAASLNASNFSQVTPEIILRYLSWLNEYTYNEIVYKNSVKAKNRKLVSLRSFYSFLFINDYIAADITKKVPMLKTENMDLSRLAKFNRSEILSAAESSYENALYLKEDYSLKYENMPEIVNIKPSLVMRDIVILKLLFQTNITTSQLVALNIDDINFKECSLEILKNNTFRSYHIDFACMENLEQYVYRERDIISAAGDSEEALFLSKVHARITERAIQNIVKLYFQKAYQDISKEDLYFIKPEYLKCIK